MRSFLAASFIKRAGYGGLSPTGGGGGGAEKRGSGSKMPLLPPRGWQGLGPGRTQQRISWQESSRLRRSSPATNVSATDFVAKGTCRLDLWEEGRAGPGAFGRKSGGKQDTAPVQRVLQELQSPSWKGQREARAKEGAAWAGPAGKGQPLLQSRTCCQIP